MKKKLIIAVTAILVLAFAVPSAFAALNDVQQKKVDEIYKQMAELRKQLIQQYVDAGQITPEQGKTLQERQAGPGLGCGFGQGPGGGFGFGRGFGGCGNCPLNTTLPDTGNNNSSSNNPDANTSAPSTGVSL